MSEEVYVARSKIRKIEGLHRRARLETGEEVDFGVHGPIAELFRLQVERPLPLLVDYIAAAAAG